MFFHPVPAHFAEELTAKFPKGEEWVVHFMNSGAEAIDFALLLARSHTGNYYDVISLTNSYHGATFGAQSLTGISHFRHNISLLNWYSVHQTLINTGDLVRFSKQGFDMESIQARKFSTLQNLISLATLA